MRARRRSSLRGDSPPFAAALDAVTDPLAVLDRTGRVVHANASWAGATASGVGPTGPGPLRMSYGRRDAGAQCDPATARVLLGVRSVLAGVEKEFRQEYRSRTPTGQRWKTVIVSSLASRTGGAVIICADRTAERAAQRQVRTLSRMLLAAHERERQAVARELHDDVTQELAAAAIDISLLARQLEPGQERARSALAAMANRVRNLSKQVQALSHRMHPHALRILGLSRAFEQECRSFAARTGIAVSTRIGTSAAPLPPAVSLAAYRIGQEALNNVSKHARATSVRVELNQSTDELQLSISDTGAGFDRPGRRSGIGLVSMKERAVAIGGRVAITSVAGRGTTVRLIVPLGGRRE